MGALAQDAWPTPAPGRGAGLDGRLADLLGGKKVILTGVTGFIGEQLLWKILTDLPTTTAGVLVRRKGSASARHRMIALVKKRIFADLREAAGGAEALLDQRVQVIEGDLPNVPELPADLDVFVHCAGDVSFDPPIDSAFKTNVLGTKTLLERILESVRDADGNLVKVPHYVHISTAYTAGRRRGAIAEAAHDNGVDYMAETRAALSLAERIEAESRTPQRLTALRKQAERAHRKAGYLTTAEDTERRRVAWVRSQLVAAGTERARSLGWTDVYTFAKTMGEKIVADAAGQIRVSIVRPAIVESSLKHPYPGWIEGFKMAEPIILAYGKGNLPEFPASPESVIDIIPCDMVVNAILAVCATQPQIGVPEYYHVSSGARNPVTFREMYALVREYFERHPFESSTRGVAQLPTWSFPGNARVERLLSTSELAAKAATRTLAIAPRSGRTRAIAKTVDRTRDRLEFLRKYLSLYGEYLRSELHFVDDHTLALHRSLHPEDRDAFSFDSAEVDWREYFQDIHCPSVTAPVRKQDAVRRRRGGRVSSTFRELDPAIPPEHVLAVFDLDGTVMSGNVIQTYLWARLPELSGMGKAAELGRLVRALPGYLKAESTDRGTFLRSFYRRYAGAELEALNHAVDRRLSAQIVQRLSPGAIGRLRDHRAAGHTTVLLTGAIRPLTRPLEPLFDIIVAADLAVDDNGRCSGFLTGPPLVGESRSAWLHHHAARGGFDLTHSYAYADSHVDLPMLSAVGNPVAVNPDLGLMRAAHRNSWSIVEWGAKNHGTQPADATRRDTSLRRPSSTVSRSTWSSGRPSTHTHRSHTPSTRSSMTRPGFVLEVDASTPPLLVNEGAACRLERLPVGTRVVYPNESLPGVADLDRAIVEALGAPLEQDPLAQRLRPGMKVVIAFTDHTRPAITMAEPDVRGRIIEQVLNVVAAAGVDRVHLVAANGLRPRPDPSQLQALVGERVMRSFHPQGLLTSHDATDPGQMEIATGIAVDPVLDDADLVISVSVVTRAAHTGWEQLATGLTSAETAWSSLDADAERTPQVGQAMGSAMDVLSIEVVLDQQCYPPNLAFLGRREWEWTLADRARWLGLRQLMATAPHRVRRIIVDKSRIRHGVISVGAGSVDAVAARSRDVLARQHNVRLDAPADVVVVGTSTATEHNPRSVMNPLVAAWDVLGHTVAGHTGTPVVRPGGVVIAYHPLMPAFNSRLHAASSDFFHRVLTQTTDPRRIRAEFETPFAHDDWLATLYRSHGAFHGLHPLWLWQAMQPAIAHCGDVIWVGADRVSADRMGFRAATTLADALEMASASVGRAPSITYLHTPPTVVADVAGAR